MTDQGLLHITSQGDYLVLQGDTERVFRNRYAMMYLKGNLSYQIENKDILIKSSESINKTMEHIDVLARYAHCIIRFGQEVNDQLNDYQEKERQFAVFSEQAKNIRDNKPIISDFRRFEESLIVNMKNRRLYPLQLLSAYHMAFSQNSCNFSVPGAGKTSVVYGAYAYLKNLPAEDSKHVDKLLIVGPLSSFGPWELEYGECFGAPVHSTRLIGGLSKDKKSIYLHSKSTSEITITSYQSVITLKDDLRYFIAHNKVMVVLDEAHKIKNTQGAITAQSVLALAESAISRVVLTGTPAPNGYEDLYNLYKFIWPDRDVISFSVAQLSNMSHNQEDERANELIKQISPFFIRVKKSDLNIPPATYREIKVDMSENQRAIYEAIEQRVMTDFNPFGDSPYLSRLRQARMIRLLQAATNPELLTSSLNLIDEDGNAYVESEDDKLFLDGIKGFIKSEIPPKFLKAAEIVEGIIDNGGRVVVWATFIKTIEHFSSYLQSRGINSKILYGATPVEGSDAEDGIETRESIVAEFNSDSPSFKVIIANPFAVAESISLHKRCHNAIYLERSFNAAHFLQSKDRIHRYGLPPDTVTTYYYLISDQSIDETVNNRLLIKEERLNQIMESMPIPLFDNALEDEGLEDMKAIMADYARRAKKI